MGVGLRVRLARVHGETPRSVLARGPLYLPAMIGDWAYAEETLEFRDYTTIGEGEFSQRAGGNELARRLRTSDLNTLTVAWDPKWLTHHNSGLAPHKIFNELRRIQRSRRAVEMLVTQKLTSGRPEMRMNVTIRALTRELRHGQPGIRYYAMPVKEWRDANLGRRTSDQSRSRGQHLPTTYALRVTTTLHYLSYEFYGSTAGWKTIAKANGIKGWGPDTELVKMHRFKIGDKVKIPKKPPLVHAPEGGSIPGGGPIAIVGEAQLGSGSAD